MTRVHGSRLKVHIARTQQLLATEARMARSWWSRMVGLLGRRTLLDDEALLIPRCRSIHTFGMQFPIDAVFVDRAFRVVALREGVNPWRIVPPVRKAWGVVEVAHGTLARLGLQVGDQLRLTAS